MQIGSEKMRYVGSKNRISKELAPIIQGYINDETVGYLEPFVGGANMIDKIVCEKRIGCDIHKELIALLNYAKDNELPESISEEEYNKVKDNKDKYESWYVGLVGFCASFGAKYFGGYGRACVRDGKQRNVSKEAIDNLRKQSANLKDIIFTNKNFLDLPKDEIKGYVIYCDIPYKGTVRYKSGEFPYEKFYTWAKEMSENNVVLISEYDMPEEFECIWSRDLRSSLGRGVNKEKDNAKIEKLFIVKKGE